MICREEPKTNSRLAAIMDDRRLIAFYLFGMAVYTYDARLDRP